MRRVKNWLFLLLMVYGTLMAAPKAEATTIVYEATDLTDVTAGEDLWQYTYTVSGYDFGTDYGFTIYFDYNLYGDIDDLPASPNGDWDVATWDVDTSIPDDGAYDAMALVASASLLDSFTVSFVWLGSGMPGTQYFEIHDDNFITLMDGYTTSDTTPVPEPSTWVLLSLGLLGLSGGRRWSSRKG